LRAIARILSDQDQNRRRGLSQTARRARGIDVLRRDSDFFASAFATLRAD
jgi:hypothetical protein